METFKINYSKNKGVSEVEFNGQLNINNIEKIAKDLKTNLNFGNSLNIVIKKVENIDLAFIQLIYSLKIKGKKEQNEVSISIDIPKDLKNLIINAGFSEFIKN